jgi:hypothetical protein
MQHRDPRLCLRAAVNHLDVLGGAAVDLVGVLLGIGVSSSSVATDDMVLSGVLPHGTASPCGRLHPVRSGSWEHPLELVAFVFVLCRVVEGVDEPSG